MYKRNHRCSVGSVALNEMNFETFMIIIAN